MNILNSNIVIACLILTQAVTACFIRHDHIEGSGNVIKQERTVKPFRVIETHGVFNLYLQQKDRDMVTIEADDNLIEFIEVYNEGQTLVIRWKKDINLGEVSKINVYVSVKELERLETKNVGTIESIGTLRMPQLEVLHAGVGNLNLKVESDYLKIKITSVGSVALSGLAREMHIKNTSVGSVKAFDLKADILHVDNSGVGKVEVCAEKEIFINSSGIGSLKYRGNAVVKELDANGIGGVEKVD